MPKYLDENGLAKQIAIEKETFIMRSEAQAVQSVSVDSAPTANSNNLVTSGGVYSAVSAKYEKPSGGIPANDLASGVIPDVSGKENTSNKVTLLSGSSTDTQYPSAKCVYDIVGDVETLINAL